VIKVNSQEDDPMVTVHIVKFSLSKFIDDGKERHKLKLKVPFEYMENWGGGPGEGGMWIGFCLAMVCLNIYCIAFFQQYKIASKKLWPMEKTNTV
jgi:hypothetical protein